MLKLIAITLIVTLVSLVTASFGRSLSPPAARVNWRKLIVFAAAALLVLFGVIRAVETLPPATVAFAHDIVSSPYLAMDLALTILVVVAGPRALSLMRRVARPALGLVQQVDAEELAYLDALQADLENKNQRNQWTDRYYVPIAALVPVQVYRLHSLSHENKTQNYSDRTNLEKIDGSRGTTYNSLDAALRRAVNANVLIAPPGSGKTVSLRNQAIQLARQRRMGSTQQIPIFVPLGKYVDLQMDGTPQAFEEFLETYFKTNGYLEFLADGHWRKLLRANRCFFFLDGLDELPRHAHQYIERARLIERFTQIWPTNNFLLSCREMDYEETLTFPQILLKPFDMRRIRAFVHKQFAADAEGVMKQLKDSPSILKLAENPFYLNLICHHVRFSQGLPQNKSQLFDSLISNLVVRESEKLAPTQARQFAARFPDLLVRLATYLAFQEMKTTGSLKGFRESLANDSDRALLLEMFEPAEWCDLIEKNEAADTVSFTHPRFKEYFSARYIREHFRGDRTVIPPDFFTNLWWRETVLFVAALDPNPNEFVSLIVERGQTLSEPRPWIQRLLRLDTMILAFDAYVGNLQVKDEPLKTDLRAYLIDYFDTEANSLEKAKVLQSLAADSSADARECIGRAMKDRSRWVAERAFFITCGGELRLRLKPLDIVDQFWRLFLNGRILWTIIPVIRASRYSRVLRWLLPLHFALAILNVLSVVAVLYVFLAFFRFALFDLQLRWSQECLQCLTTIGMATLVTIYCLSRDEYPWFTRFIYSAPVALMSQFLVFNNSSSVVVRSAGIGSGLAFAWFYQRSRKDQSSATRIQFVGLVLLGLSLAVVAEQWLYSGRLHFGISEVEDTLGLDRLLPPDTAMILLLLSIIGLGITCLVLIVRELYDVAAFVRGRSLLQALLSKDADDDTLVASVAAVLSAAGRGVWADKLLVENLVRTLSNDPGWTAGRRVEFLTRVAASVDRPSVEDAVFQKVETQERSYRRELIAAT